jgi:crossover junction endodeoxyribonuclease RusA
MISPPPESLITPTCLTMVVYGTPAPQGSKTRLAHGAMVESNATAVRTWREDVKFAAMRALEATPEWTSDYPYVMAVVTFALPRPKSHFGTGRNADRLRPNAPVLHGTKPDLDKLLRSTLDALKAAGAYADDQRVARVDALKGYTGSGTLDRPGALITLRGERP